MVHIKHIGIYVKNLDVMERFYQEVFSMKKVCSKEKQGNILLDELLQVKGREIQVTKLITEYGKKTGIGDMIELVKVLVEENNKLRFPPIYELGAMHISFDVYNISEIVKRIQEHGGVQKTEIIDMSNGNLCCFCVDPEGNWIELIQKIDVKLNKGEIR